jgi:hypothetical protein
MGDRWDKLTFGSSRRRRSMRRRLAVLDREFDSLSKRSAGDDGWEPFQSKSRTKAPKERRPRKNAKRSIVIAVVLLVVMSGGTNYVLRGLRAVGVPIDDSPVSAVYSSSRPSPGVGEAKHPLGTPQTPPSGAGGYTFMKAFNGQPARYDSCRPIHYVIRDDGESTTLRDALVDAIRNASQASGLQFVYDGTTTEVPTNGRGPYQPGRYGRRWAPVLIAFTNPQEISGLAANIVGLGGSNSAVTGLGSSQRTTYVSGIVYLDTPQLMNERPGRDYTVTHNVAEHEIGHLLGLDHVTDRNDVMYPMASTQANYGPGDLRGLAILGSGPCVPDV